MVRLLYVIKNAKLFIGGEFIEGSIVIEGRIIKALTKDEVKYVGKADKVFDAKGLPLIPGGIDIHAHIYDPDYIHHEDFITGTTAAAFGGITTVFDMPLRMYVDDPSKFDIKLKEGLRNSLVNFGIHAGMMNEKNWFNIEKLAYKGVIGFKIFTCKPFKSSDEGIIRIMEELKRFNRVAFVHAEDDLLIDLGLEAVKGRSDPLAHHEARSDVAEAVAINRVIMFGKNVGVHVHIAHVSSGLGAEMIRVAKSLKINVTAETCPQYLYFSRDDVVRFGNYLKITPSLKNKDDVRALWEAVKDGTIDAIASDHAPAPREEKEVGVWEAWGGIPVIELIIPFMYTFGVKRGYIDFKRFVEVISAGPAKSMHIYPQKGSERPGSDADLVVLDVNTCRKVKASELHHKVDWCPFEGIEMCGWPLHVFVCGEPIVLDRELVGKPGVGKYVGILPFES